MCYINYYQGEAMVLYKELYKKYPAILIQPCEVYKLLEKDLTCKLSAEIINAGNNIYELSNQFFRSSRLREIYTKWNKEQEENMCYKKNELDLYHVGYVSVEDLQRVKHLINQADKSKLQTEYKRILRLFDSDDNSNLVTELQRIEHETNAKRKEWLKEIDTMYKHYTVNKICVGNDTHKLQDGEKRDIEIVDNYGNRNIIKLAINWKQKQEENMQSNIKYYTSLEMVEKIKNGFGRKIDDGNIYFEATLKSGTLAKTLPNSVKYEKGNFYFYQFCIGVTLIPIDTLFGIDEPVFKPIQPKIVNIDFHGVIIPVSKCIIEDAEYIACDSDGLVLIYDKCPTASINHFLSKSHGKCKVIANIEYEGDWKQSCTEIKLVEVK